MSIYLLYCTMKMYIYSKFNIPAHESQTQGAGLRNLTSLLTHDPILVNLPLYPNSWEHPVSYANLDWKHPR